MNSKGVCLARRLLGESSSRARELEGADVSVLSTYLLHGCNRRAPGRSTFIFCLPLQYLLSYITGMQKVTMYSAF